MLKAPRTFPDKSEDETLVCLGDKKHEVQSAPSAAPTPSTLGLTANGTISQPEDSDTSSSVTLAGRIFADSQANDMYKEFMDADDDI